MVDVESLRYWPILNYVPASLLKNIRLVYVFGHAGSDVLLVTKDDELLVFGFNSSRCLSVEDHRCQYNSVSLNKIEELSKKRIKGFAFCTYSHANIFVLAYLENGEVYSWGNDPANEEVFKTPSLIDSLPKTVTEVACGSKHILALTSDGEVFAWGCNTKKQVNHLNEEVISVPVKITGALSCEHVVKISCGSYFSVVLTSNGIMYSWGENDNGQLGLNMESQFEGTPTRIDLKATCISHIACGDDHVLALDSDGYLFSWGWNDCRQLGFDDIIRQSFPTIVDRRLRFNDVAAYIDLSVAVSFDGVVKVWGKTAGECNSVFISTPCRTIDEAFALFNCGKMYKAIEITSENESVSETLLRSFGVQESSDFKFIVEGKDIYVHKTILKLRSEYFDGMFRNQWREASMSSVEINENYEAMVAYLKYLYTGELNIDSRVAFEVYIIADKYCETNLINLSLRKFREGLDVDNVAELYELAYDREMTSVTDLCINFAAYNMQSVIKSEGFQKWKVDTYRSFFGESRISEACGNRGIYYR